MRRIVWITSQFVAYHRWAKAPEDTAFLRNYHRHMFHVKMGIEVLHGDREVEFFDLKRRLDEYINDEFREGRFGFSCEIIAELILDEFNASWVEVSEDGENGAIVEKDRTLPAWEKKGKCFVGVEAEGPLRGTVTLFVPGCVEAKRFVDVYRQVEGDVRAVYYGAGNDIELRRDTLEEMQGSGLEHLTLDMGFEMNCDGIFYKKVVTELAVSWVKGDQRFVTLKTDLLYSMDRYVE